VHGAGKHERGGCPDADKAVAATLQIAEKIYPRLARPDNRSIPAVQCTCASCAGYLHDGSACLRLTLRAPKRHICHSPPLLHPTPGHT